LYVTGDELLSSEVKAIIEPLFLAVRFVSEYLKL
jgi:hypothetical protein